MRITDFARPTTPAASAALTVATRHHSTAMLNHVTRSWLWAEAFAAVEGRRDYDRELLYVAALMHDVGLVEAFDTVGSSYEEAGGQVAAVLTTGAGWSAARSQRILEVIVRHNWPSVDPGFDEEGYLLETATALDISGARPDALPEDFVSEVLEAFPRLTLAAEFGAGVADQAARKPTTSAARLVRGGIAKKLHGHPFEARAAAPLGSPSAHSRQG